MKKAVGRGHRSMELTVASPHLQRLSVAEGLQDAAVSTSRADRPLRWNLVLPWTTHVKGIPRKPGAVFQVFLSY